MTRPPAGLGANAIRAVARAFVVLVPLVIATPAVHAASIPFTAQLSLTIATLNPVIVSGGGVAIVNGSGGGSHIASLQLPANAITTVAAALPVTDPNAFPIAGLQLTLANAMGNFSGTGGLMALPGIAKVCLFAPCASAVTNLSVPLSAVGVAGQAFVSGPVNLSVYGAPWTTGTAQIGALSAMGSRHGPASATSSTAQPSGQLQLVTPINISTNIGSSAVIPAFAVLTLHFVPEPGTMLLLGGGFTLLAAIGRRRSLAQR